MRGLRAAFLCTGNRFRSPLAAAIFRQELVALRQVAEIESFGVLDASGAAALDEAVILGRRMGVNLSDHRARRLEATSLADFDLVVGFERFHLATAVVDGGADRDATYTLPEIVTLLAQVAAEESGPQARIAAASSRRDVGKTFSGVPEIADPLGLTPPAQRKIAMSVVELARELARVLYRP